MKRASIRPSRQIKNRPAKNLYQSSRSRYLRAFASARAMRFWRPRITGKELTVAAVFTAALAIGPSAAQAQFPASLDLNTLNGTNGFVINGINSGDENGYSVSSAGDVNGDGFDDLIIASVLGDPNDEIDAGETFVVFGQIGGFSSSFDLSTLNGSNGFVINGIDTYDFSGNSISGAGDVNGDGFDDIFIGAASAGNSFDGQSYVVFRSNSGSSSLDLNALDGSNGFAINGIDSGDFSGGSVSDAGDVNGDGFDDIIIGAASADPNGSTSGESYVVFGNNNGFASSLDLSTLDGTNGFVINGIDERDRSGGSVSGAGDVNGDGFDDLIIGASAADPNGTTAAGESYVVFGNNSGFSPSLDLSTLNGSNGFVINGVDETDFSGDSVSGAGDFNGDGFDDLIIGASSANPNGMDNAGKSYVVFGNNTGFSSSLDLSALDGTNGFVINGIDAEDRSGGSVSDAGDVNGDGFDDIIVGAFRGDPNGNSSAGESYVLFGQSGGFSSSFDFSSLDGTNGFVISGIDEEDRSGWSVSGAGDVNGDGFDDLVIGAPGMFFDHFDPPIVPLSTGRSYVVFGRASVSAPILGDVNQDGVVDFLDIAPFISILASNDYLVEADINEDEVVNFLDIQPFIDTLASQQ